MNKTLESFTLGSKEHVRMELDQPAFNLSLTQEAHLNNAMTCKQGRFFVLGKQVAAASDVIVNVDMGVISIPNIDLKIGDWTLPKVTNKSKNSTTTTTS